ncbi:MAG TPA: NPCBM/NEW2 domain-containing protein [Polyangiaceae bacterium]|nr:NPCBM/NEW2 domain-containing protein [Polyangiaceae bacterium]
MDICRERGRRWLLVPFCSGLLLACGSETAPLEQAPEAAPSPATSAAPSAAPAIGPRGGLSSLGLASRRALDELPAAEVMASGKQGLPVFVRGRLGKLAAAGRALTHDDLKPVLPSIAAVFGVQARDLRTTKVDVDALGQTHVRLKQSIAGRDVVGGDLVLHVDRDGTVFAVNGTAQGEDAETPHDVSIDASAATQTALHFAGGGALVAAAADLKYVMAATTGALRLAWEVPVRGTNGRQEQLWNLVYVDATDGSIVNNLPKIHRGLSRALYTGNGENKGRGDFLFGEEGPSDYTNPGANDNYWLLGSAWEFYFKVFGRDSWDNQGHEIISTVDTGGESINNAAWNGEQLFFGAGDNNVFANLATSSDVVLHEYTHAIMQSESDLALVGEPGAINESMADIFAAIYDDWSKGGYDAWTWLVADDVRTPNGPDDDALRYLNDPPRDNRSVDNFQARLYPWDCEPDESNDYCGVHGNAGISSLAFYLAVAGGTRQGVVVTPVGMAQARWIFYRAAIHYLTKFETFSALRAATVQSARDLYGATAAARIGTAWDAVGVYNPPVNDNIASATTIGSLPADLYGDTSTASTEYLEFGKDQPSVWYKWTPARSGVVTINITSPGMAPSVRLGVGTTVDQTGVGEGLDASPLRVAVVAGSTYALQARSPRAQGDPFDLSLVEASDTVFYLSDLAWKSATNGFGGVERDKSNGQSASGDGTTLTLNGTAYSKGLGVHGASDVRYDLAQKYERFLASIGVDDEVGSSGSVVFQVFADSAKIYDSGTMTGSSTTKNVDLNVAGKSELRLVVTDAGNGNGSDHADWANARVTPNGVTDVLPPTAPTNAFISFVEPTAAGVTWRESTESSPGLMYQVMQGTKQLGGTTNARPYLQLRGLTPGARYDLTIRAVDAAGNISGPSNALVLQMPARASGNGLMGEYFAGMRFDGLPKASIAGAVNFNWSGSPATNVPADYFSARWSGEVTPAFTQTYTFYARTDDGARLWVDDRLLIDKWVNQGATEWSGSVALEANRRYAIRLEMYDATGSAVAQLSWSSSSQPKQIIPVSRLSH